MTSFSDAWLILKIFAAGAAVYFIYHFFGALLVVPVLIAVLTFFTIRSANGGKRDAHEGNYDKIMFRIYTIAGAALLMFLLGYASATYSHDWDNAEFALQFGAPFALALALLFTLPKIKK